ncbi:P2 family phage major capsid protein [Escherichia coli]
MSPAPSPAPPTPPVLERQPKDFAKLASNKYECDQINFDFYIAQNAGPVGALSVQLNVRNAIIKRQSLDLIMAGFNGVRRAETSDRSSNPMLQDVAVGWLQKYRNEAPARVMSKVTDEERAFPPLRLSAWVRAVIMPALMHW